MNKKKFGAYIKESRLNKNYTQQELADLLFVDVSAVSKWERGISYPDITLVPDICRVLEVSEHELIESSHDEEYRKIKKAANKYNNMKKGTFWTLNICYALAILICFIVNIAVSHCLSWFYIVLTSILCAYSFCPTITWLFRKYKKLIFLVSTYISMFLLFLTCSIYSNNYWFMIPTIGVLIGYFVIFFPILFKKQKGYLKEETYIKLTRWFMLIYVASMFVLTCLLLIIIYIYIKFNIGIALLITGGCFMIPIILGILNIFETAKTLNKPILLSFIGVIVCMLVVCLSRSLYFKLNQTTTTYVIEDVYNDINIIGKNVDINIYLSTNGENKVVYKENKQINTNVSVTNQVLTINQSDNRKFYDKLFDFGGLKMDLYLSISMINKLDINAITSDIDINEGFNFNDVTINNTTGDIEFKSMVNNNLKISLSTGDVEIEDSNINGDLNITSTTGNIELENVKANDLDIKVSTGDTDLDNVIINNNFRMIATTGNLKLDGFDANDIEIELFTGSVRGTVLTSKVFITKSSTGSINVPETLTGGRCKITTTTGSIIITYK